VNLLTFLLITTTTLCTIAAQLLLKRAVNGPGMSAAMSHGPLAFVISAAFNPLVLTALSLQIFGYIVWFFVLTRERLAIAFAISGSTFYILMAFAAMYFYGERMGIWQWVGIVFISLGVLLITRTR
jgi:drug/metabolite transporter (DMT)-like permease